MKMENCNKFNSCSAPICPLDPDWEKRNYLKGEPSCLYLREHSKIATRANLAYLLPKEFYSSICQVHAEIMARTGVCGIGLLRTVLTESSKTGSKIFSSFRESPAELQIFPER